MDILWPGFFYLLGLIPLLIGLYIWILRRRKRFTVRYSSLSLIRDVLPKQARWKRHIPFALFLLALAGLVFALVRPVAVVSVPTAKRTIILAIDVSRSMCGVDIPPNRLEAAKAAASAFIQQQNSNTEIGVVAFAGFAAVVQPPTNDQELLLDAIDNLRVARRTAIGSGILKSIDTLAESDQSISPSTLNPSTANPLAPTPQGDYKPAIIVVLTDGVSNVGPRPLDAAQQAVERGLRVYTIGFGTANNSVAFNCNPGVPQGDDQFGFGGGNFGGGGFGGGGFRRGIDEATLQEVADLTGGEYYAAESANELQDVFQKLPTELITRTETMEISVFFAAFSALLLLLAMVLSMLWSPLN
jgi:Ca-activated chloride channel family protein